MLPIRFAITAMLPLTLAAAPSPDWPHAGSFEVKLSNFSYSPEQIHLKAGQPVRLRLVNTASGGHDFSARLFFASASIRPQDGNEVKDGKVELSGHQSRDILLVPKAGRYPLKCTHSFHKALGMSGTIVVD